MGHEGETARRFYVALPCHDGTAYAEAYDYRGGWNNLVAITNIGTFANLDEAIARCGALFDEDRRGKRYGSFGTYQGGHCFEWWT